MSDKITEADIPAAGISAEPERETAKTGKKKTAGKKPAADSGICVYLGPTIMGTIQHGTIYRGSQTEVLASLSAAVEKYPLIASLVISGDMLPDDRIKVKTPGNLLYVNYHKLAAGAK